MSDQTKKEQIYSAHFYPFLSAAADKWMQRRIIPYSRCYSDAYAMFTETKQKATEDRQKRVELYIAVGMLAGTALCALGPVAGVLAAGSLAVLPRACLRRRDADLYHSGAARRLSRPA